MEDLLTERHPLFGRRTMSLELGPMPLREAAQFLPSYAPSEMISAYAVFGGVPKYLELCDPRAPLRENIVRLVMSKPGQLFDEPETLLKSELREPKRYASIISRDCGGRYEAVGDSRTSGTQGYRSTDALCRPTHRPRLHRRQRSFDATERERDARYAVSDPLTRFWYRFVKPEMSAVSLGFGREVFDRAIQTDFPDYMGAAFERVCREHLRRYAQERMSVPAGEIGKIWSTNYDLDIAGRLLDKSWVFGECKWTAQRVGTDILAKLKRNAEAVSSSG